MIDDCRSNPKANPTDREFLESVYKLVNADTNKLISRPPPKESQEAKYSVNHYADNSPVWYLVDGFLEKNSSKVPKDLISFLAGSTNPVLKSMYLIINS